MKVEYTKYDIKIMPETDMDIVYLQKILGIDPLECKELNLICRCYNEADKIGLSINKMCE